LNTNSETNELLDEEVKVWLKEYKNTDDSKTKIQLRNLILHYYMPLVKKIAHGLARRQSDPIEDIVQVGCLGLMKSIEQFNQNQGASFKTYAAHRITGEIRHYLRDKVSVIKAPRELVELSGRMNLIIEKLRSKLGRQPTEIEVAHELQMPVNIINEAFDVDRRKVTVSLDQSSTFSENEVSLGDRLIDDKYTEYQNIQEERIMLMEAVELLPANLKQVIQMTFFEDLNQTEIAQKVGISQMQVSRRLKKATKELFNIITALEKRQSGLIKEKKKVK